MQWSAHFMSLFVFFLNYAGWIFAHSVRSARRSYGCPNLQVSKWVRGIFPHFKKSHQRASSSKEACAVRAPAAPGIYRNASLTSSGTNG